MLQHDCSGDCSEPSPYTCAHRTTIARNPVVRSSFHAPRAHLQCSREHPRHLLHRNRRRIGRARFFGTTSTSPACVTTRLFSLHVTHLLASMHHVPMFLLASMLMLSSISSSLADECVVVFCAVPLSAVTCDPSASRLRSVDIYAPPSTETCLLLESMLTRTTRSGRHTRKCPRYSQEMLAFYGCAIQFPRYNSQVRGKQWKTIKVLNSYRTPDVVRHLPQRNTTAELARALQPTKLKWPKGGMVSSRFTSAPCLEETRAFEAAASRAVDTKFTIRTLYLHNDSYRCSAPEHILTREGADDGFWQTFL